MKIKSLLVLLLVFSSIVNKAQTTIGLQVGSATFFEASTSPFVGLYVVNDASIIEDHTVFLQYILNYHFPFTMKGSDYAYPIGNSNIDRIDLRYTNKISMFELQTCGRIYFGDRKMDDMNGLYGLIGLTLGYAHFTITPEPYDETKYTPGVLFSDPVKSFFQPFVDLGLGYDKVFDNGQVFGAQFLFNIGSLKINSYPGKTGTHIYVPSSIGISFTYSFDMDN